MVSTRGPAHTGAWRAGAIYNYIRSLTQKLWHAQGIKNKLSLFEAFFVNIYYRSDRLLARRHGLLLHFFHQKFQNSGVCFWPVPLVR
jgi:predicted ATPase